ncbi:hypothetical protein [Spirilliplanes yamanashiensis]|uniref:Uncharacterized protein n=1 Tax=Spirilliplanes yamanashiensis TaxID=42233 RepID=A0A8J4DGQ6_9ACTN|nr:hypothetical protein [Spirilliplanes yamanashiensis]MDP9819865.1 hypothetical protein [Spirilliplanes yamanashiensis]GIJ01316.1 hypothetical protein Sya03_06680 [Spirilliplanes yamanashiensis]
MTLTINGMRLPDILVEAIRSGTWRAPERAEIYVEVFGEPADVPEFYDERMMRRENDGWDSVSVDDYACVPQEPGNLGVDLDRSVIIAGLGPDMPVVLDYRQSLESPRVLYLAGNHPHWVEVASDIEDLFDKLGIR